MKNYLKKAFKLCAGAMLAVSMINGASADLAATCKKKVSELCSSKLCREFCANTHATECNCNAMNGLCKLGATGRDDILQGQIEAQFAACKASAPEAQWKAVQTDEWIASLPKKSTANKNEDVRPGELRVGEATKLAEKLVHAECIEVHAPKYCEAKKMADCDAESLCKTKPKELKAQVEAQLMACIAAKRDPSARKTGRPEYACPTKTPIPWCSINSPSWREEILYPDPEKEVKKKRYMDALADLNTQIADAKKAHADHKELDKDLKNLVLEKSLGQLAEEAAETAICEASQKVASCRGDTHVAEATAAERGA